ncbi:probable endoplasmic reticulum-Golgi intermediate compartment protein [Coccomyxa sp. Obi]|nr:probable endoplasmic reticulum-Golgi intermediate compartment protein [Coccomyxa sp. Obi]
MARVLQKLRSVDFYRKIPNDLTEATLAGASISLIAAVTIMVLLTAELSSFLAIETKEELVVDRSAHGDLLRINFNITFPSLSCEFATLDVSDALGTKRMNLTKTIRKLPINEDGQRAGYYVHDDLSSMDIKYDDPPREAPAQDFTLPLTKDSFKSTLDAYSIVVVNFYAPWCPWCQRLEPTWEAVTQEVHTKYPDSDGRLRFAKVDCTTEVDLCREHQITGFPSIRVFRLGHDEVNIHGVKEHESYRGDRTQASLLGFADNLAPSAGKPHHYIRGVTRMAQTSGCALSGFVLVKKVPGALHFLAKSPGHSFDHGAMNMSHVVNYLYFGNKPSPRRHQALAKLHPAGLSDDWADKLAGQEFFSRAAKATFEHYMQVVLTTIEPSKHRPELSYDAYEYTVHSHTYDTTEIPAAKLTYDLSPIQILVSEKPRAWYHFVTTTCAIIGGVFTVAGIVDGLVHTGARLAKKVELGKHT